jgi:hypothetical protein
MNGEMVYHLRASLKDPGKMWFAFFRQDNAVLSMMDRIEKITSGTCK